GGRGGAGPRRRPGGPRGGRGRGPPPRPVLPLSPPARSHPATGPGRAHPTRPVARPLMDEQANVPTPLPPSGSPRADFRCLALLLLLTTAMRVWQVSQTEVTSRDSIGYIRIAWRLGHGDWREGGRSSPQHPLYPLAVLGTSVPVRRLLPGADLADAMRLSAQLASAAASVLFVVPMFYLGKELFDRRVGFWAALLLQCLPATGKLMADGLSEPLFLLWAASALLSASRALRTGSAGGFVLAGLCGGLAYLTRPEGLLVPAAAGLVLLGLQASRRWRRPWPACLRNGAALTAATLAVVL